MANEENKKGAKYLDSLRQLRDSEQLGFYLELNHYTDDCVQWGGNINTTLVLAPTIEEKLNQRLIAEKVLNAFQGTCTMTDSLNSLDRWCYSTTGEYDLRKFERIGKKSIATREKVDIFTFDEDFQKLMSEEKIKSGLSEKREEFDLKRLIIVKIFPSTAIAKKFAEEIENKGPYEESIKHTDYICTRYRFFKGNGIK
jgi:hypothetical protein